MDEIRTFEHSTLKVRNNHKHSYIIIIIINLSHLLTVKVPYEGLNKTFRGSQKVIDRELSYVLGAASEATDRSKDPKCTSDDVVNALDNVIQKLTSLKRKVITPHKLF